MISMNTLATELTTKGMIFNWCEDGAITFKYLGANIVVAAGDHKEVTITQQQQGETLTCFTSYTSTISFDAWLDALRSLIQAKELDFDPQTDI